MTDTTAVVIILGKGGINLRRTITLLVACLLLAFPLSGCGQTSSTVSSANYVNYSDEDGNPYYKIIYDSEADDGATLASLVKQAFKDKLNLNLEALPDLMVNPGDYEILIGNTDRSESGAATELLLSRNMGRFNDFIINFSEKKIIINGMSNEAIANAVDFYIKNYIKSDGIEKGFIYTAKTEGDFMDICINSASINQFNIVYGSKSVSWLVQNEAEKITSFIRDNTGFSASLHSDTEVAEQEYEILIGNTNRSNGKNTKYSYEEYDVLISDKKVYLNGGSNHAVQVAISEFLKLLEKGNVTDSDSISGIYSKSIADYDSSSYYKLVWSDEFDGNTLDTSKWSITQMEYKGAQLTVNDKTLSFKDGNLIMRGYKEGEQYIHCDAIQSSGKFRYHGGYLEMRARIPDGKGVYSSFWGNGSNAENTGDLLEIDIFESLGQPHRQQANIHMWYKNGEHTSLDGKVSNRYYELASGNLSDDYHIIGMLWTDDEISFYYDGTLYYSQKADKDFCDKFINIYAGFNVGWNDRTPPDDDTAWPLEYCIDYIRLYQIDGQGIIYNP